jgi:hypothetical protein
MIIHRSPFTFTCPSTCIVSKYIHSQQQRQHTVSPSSAMTRQINASASLLSLAGPSNPMCREAVHAATLVLCKAMLRPSQRASLGVREAEEVECRMCALARLKRVWGKSRPSTNGSMTQVGSSASEYGRRRESEGSSLRRCRMAMSSASE